jgi:membrane-associated phospholipid phosphatase
MDKKILFQLSLIALSAAFLILMVMVKTFTFFPFDLAITKTIQTISLPGFAGLMWFLTYIGFAWGEIILPVVASAIFYLAKQKKEAVFILISSYGAIFISEFFKMVVQRPRPDASLISQIGHYTLPDSFPSGHVLFYIGFFGYLLYLTYSKMKPGLLQYSLIILLTALIYLIGVSRIYLGAHWFSDATGSYLVGSIWLIVVVHMHNHLPQRWP